MAVEIERKFLVTSDSWRASADEGRRFCQGHILRDGDKSVRIRRAHDKAFITVKGRKNGRSRPEFEYEIPVADAEEMLKSLCRRPLLEKTRYCVKYDGVSWEVDVFSEPPGLVVAEVELSREDQPLPFPPWIGDEVTNDPRYRSSSIAEAASN